MRGKKKVFAKSGKLLWDIPTALSQPLITSSAFIYGYNVSTPFFYVCSDLSGYKVRHYKTIKNLSEQEVSRSKYNERCFTSTYVGGFDY